MLPSEYKARVAQVLDQLHAHAEMMESKTYTDPVELGRDMAIGIELANQYTDLLGEIVETIETEGLS